MQEEPKDKEATWEFHDDTSAYSAEQPEPTKATAESISWTGSEFIDSQKTAGWYLALTGFIVLVSGVVYLISKDIISVVFIVIMGILFAVIAGRKPKQLQYIVDDQGITVGNRSYIYTDFKSFSLQRHGVIGYVSLLPLHRFHNELSIYFPPENEQQIFEALARHIPNEQRKETYIDRLAKLARF